MKKIIIAFGVVAMAVAAKAAVVDWQYKTTDVSEKNYTLYVFSAAVATSYDTFADFTAGAIGSDVVATVKVGPRTEYKTSVVNQANAPSTLYFALIENSSATSYKYGSISTAGFTYDPDKQQSSPGTLAISEFTGSGTIGTATPEPTSTMLMLLGVAGLALRRKQK